MSEGNGVRITTKDLYDKLEDVATDVSTLLSQMQAAVKTDADHETRIRALEQWRYALPATALMGACGLLLSVLVAAFK